MRIDFESEDRTIEIDGKEYTVAERTVEVQEKLEKLDMNQPQYKRMIAAVEVLLGKDAAKELFKSGKKENIDRVEAIFHGVFEVFDKATNEMRRDKQQEPFAKLAESVEPLNRLMELAMKLSKAK